jgi:hypothetical protein
MPPPLTPLAPLPPRKPMAPLRPMTPLQPQRPRQPMVAGTPGGARASSPSSPPTVRYVQYDDATGVSSPPVTLPPPDLPPPPPPEPPRVVNLGLSRAPIGGWGGIPLPTPRGPVPLPRPGGNKTSGYAVWVFALVASLISAGAFKFASVGSDDRPDISVPSVSVSIPPISVGGSKRPARPAPARPTHLSGRALDLNGSFDGQRIRVTFARWVNNATPTNTFLDTPDKGNRLVAAQFRVKNIGSAIYVASATSAAQVVDTRGRSYQPVFVFDPLRQGNLLDTVVSLTTGHVARGYVAFEVPKNARIKQVRFSGGSGGSSQTGTWTFTR